MGVERILWMLLAGIGIATVSVFFTRRFVGSFVRKLIEIDAASPETAVTPEELHCRMSLPLRMALREGGSLSGSVLAEESGGSKRYYIAPEKLAMLKCKYRKEKVSGFFLLLALFVIIALGLAFAYCYPLLTEFLGSLFSD